MFRKRTYQERFWEILPGLSIWTVFLGSILLSVYKPIWAALFIICFDLYWVLKAVNSAAHLIASYRKFNFFATINWLEILPKLENLPGLQAEFFKRVQITERRLEKRYFEGEVKRLGDLIEKAKGGGNFLEYYHLILVPFSNESFEVLDSTFSALVTSDYPTEQMVIILAAEERAGENGKKVAAQVEAKYGKSFHNFFTTYHPDGLPDEIRGKSANASFAVSCILSKLAELGIAEDKVIVSNFDSDSIVHPQYFSRVMYEFLTAENPYRSSYQPIAIYNNNIWDSPAFIRVVAVSDSFFLFTEGSRPDRLRTFSSHSMSLKALREVGFWKKDIVNEDGYIYWQCYLKYEGDYHVVPLFMPISLDTCLADTFWQTLKNQYKQKRRWAYNVEYYPHLVPKLLKSKAPFWDRMIKLWQYVEGNFNWATASILISSLGWLPLLLGGNEFSQSVVAFNLPKATSVLMSVATLFLIFSVYINFLLLPPRPAKYGKMKSVMMYLQWFLIPLTAVIFTSLPAVDAQTRLMFGKYLEFWVTPKSRKGEVTAHRKKEAQGARL